MAGLNDFRKAFSTLVTETLFLLRDPSGERYTSTRIKEKLNEATLTWCIETQLLKETINVRLILDQYEYDIKTLVAADATLREFGFPLRVGYDGDDEAAVMPGSLLSIDLKGYRRDLSQMPTLWYLCAVSPGKIQILGPATATGTVLPSTNGNIQVTYVAMPDLMVLDADFPDGIISYFHKYLPYGAAALFLEESDDKNDLALADFYEGEFSKGMLEQVAEDSRGRTAYEDVHPL